jgi:hypothetical protein
MVARGYDKAAAFAELRVRAGHKGGTRPPVRRAHVHTLGCTLDAYAQAKRLPAEFLTTLGISEYKDARWPNPVLRIPYRDADGTEPAVRIRVALTTSENGDQRFIWRKGSKPCLYGLWRARADGAPGEGAPIPYLVLVEGESCCHTLWHHGIPALGLPGANSWREHRDLQHLEGTERVYVVIEPDRGGEAVLDWLSRSRLRDRAWLVEVPGGDVSALHVDSPETFVRRFQAALEAAEPWRERAAAMEDADRRELGARCAPLARAPRILDVFANDLRATGIVGEERLAQLVYLAATSRLLDKIVSVAVKGPSSAGKSIVVERSLSFFPGSAFYVLTAMSERGLIFVDEGMSHRMLVVYEAAGMAGDMQSYLLRSLLSEGRIRYQMAAKSGGEIKGRLVELEGPTGLIVTTTAVSLHPENETRLLSVTATDTHEQTRRVLAALADEEQERVDLAPWHALQRWLELGESRVTIPYAAALAELVPPVAVRLRRDFGAVLGLIRAHALLHQASRERDDRGRIIATLDDYAVVRQLVVDVVSEGVQATVKPEVRQAVETVASLAGDDGATRKQLGLELELDPSAAGRRLQAASAAGYIRNLETSRDKPARWVPGDPLPDDMEILPTPDTLARACVRVHVDFEGCTPPPGGHEFKDPASAATSKEEAEAERIMTKIAEWS